MESHSTLQVSSEKDVVLVEEIRSLIKEFQNEGIAQNLYSLSTNLQLMEKGLEQETVRPPAAEMIKSTKRTIAKISVPIER
ncbi:hypothetical protein ACFOU2_06300 [Bacillus songklensis]|uniref:Uncharacterized protein n=1 Tax=Bacillus songklensis TaxID=1069116 RepID=A0ABV8B0J5_9BACI